MAIEDQQKSFATNDSNTYKLYENRKVYKKKVLMTNAMHQHNDHNSYIRAAFADFWYDRFLFGRINRAGDVIIPREDFLEPLPNKKNQDIRALEVVAVAFGDFRTYFNRHTNSNLIPNKNTLFASIEPSSAWQSIYDVYHEHMSMVYKVFRKHMRDVRGEDKINNFEDFAEEFFIFCQNILVGSAKDPITLSGFLTSNLADPRCGGLTIDLFKARASNDLSKNNFFINDINFNFYVDAANKHGFVIDKNIPWRLHANLSSEYMKFLMESEAFEVKYSIGQDNIFDVCYLKAYTMDLILLRKYMYDMYGSILSTTPAYTKQLYCQKTQKIKTLLFNRKTLSTVDREKTYNVRDYWLDKAFRFRLLELDNDFLEVDIAKYIKDAKSVYDIRGEMKSLKYLHEQTKRFFVNNYNKTRKSTQVDAPRHQ